MAIPEKMKFDSNGLITAIAQDANNGEVLMLAFMNEEALKLTIETNVAHYYSRSRNKLWKKGESSGNLQEVKEIRVDCDEDCVILLIKQIDLILHILLHCIGQFTLKILPFEYYFPIGY